MHGNLLRFTGKPVVAILCVLSLLTMCFGAVSRAADAESWDMWPRKTTEPEIELNLAADAANEWETWPRKKAEPRIEPKPATEAKVAAEAEDDANKRKTSRKSYGKIGWIVLGIAAIVGIGIAVGGGGDDGGTVTNPGHQ